MLKDKIAVIGGAGFVGSRLAKRFDYTKNEYTICDIKIDCMTRDFVLLDVEDPASLDQIYDAKIIINLAAVHLDNVHPPSRYDDVNVGGATNICEMARKYCINKIIFTSSVAIYGFAPANTAEDGAANYHNDYGRTKYLAEGVYKEWQAEDSENRTLVIVRPVVIFGEGNRGNVYNLLKQIALGRFVMFGNGANRKSMAYVENLAAFLEYSLSFRPGVHIYNYCDKPDLDMNALVLTARKNLFGKTNVGLRLPVFLGIGIGYIADVVTKLTGISLAVSSIRVKKFIATSQFSSAASNTGFSPPISLKEGLARTIRYEFLEDHSNEKPFDTE